MTGAWSPRATRKRWPAAVEILSSPQTLRRMSAAARATAVSRFNSEAVIPRYIDAYERLLSSR